MATSAGIESVEHSACGVLEEHVFGAERLLDVLPMAVCVCDRAGRIVCCNREAVALWGREPKLNDLSERFCGSYRMYRLDGRPLPHRECPMAVCLETGVAVRDQELVIERPSGVRAVALVSIDPIRDASGNVVGAIKCLRDVTERRRDQAALREQTRWLREVLKALPAAVYMTDAAGRITAYNEAAVKLWGVRPEIGKSEFCGSWRLAWPDGTPMRHDECPMAVALKEDRPIAGAEAAAVRPDGTRIPFLAYPTPLHDETGALTGAVNMLVDIAERKAAEEALRRSEARFRAIVSQTIAGIAETDLDGRFIHTNDRYCEMVGYSHAELSRMRMQDITHPDDLPRNLELFGELVRNGTNFVIEKRYIRKDGSRVWVSNSVSGVRDANGLLTNAVAVSLDISERRRAEEAMHRLAAIVESSDDAIIRKNLNGVIETWNTGAERLFGYTAEEAIGRPVTILMPPGRQHEEPQILARLSRGEHIEPYETVRRRKDGSLIDIALTVSPIKDAHGQVIGASKIARDITERRRGEAQRQLLLREMSHRVKNVFALAGGLVALSARSAETPQGLAEAVRDRLAALARAHELTLPDYTAGAEEVARPTTLPDLAATILSPFGEVAGGEGRIAVDGPEVTIAGKAVSSLALLLHELATNAAKYGALSSPAGRVAVGWMVEAEALSLLWQERDGPPIAGKAQSEGFGSLLARRAVKGQLGGDITHEWDREGLSVRIAIPLAQLTQ